MDIHFLCKAELKELRSFSFIEYDKQFYFLLGTCSSTIEIFLFTGKELKLVKSFSVSFKVVNGIDILGKDIVVAAGSDGSIIGWKFKTLLSDHPEIVFNLHEHKKTNICFLKIEDLTMLTSSFGSIAVIFLTNKTLVLKHEQFAIWSVIRIPGLIDTYVTVGADSSLRKWDGDGKLIKRVNDISSFPLRSGVYFDNRLYIVGNDGFLTVWSTDLVLINKVRISLDYLYSISLLEPGLFGIAGEDKSFYIVKIDKVIDIAFVTCCVWSGLKVGRELAILGENSINLFTSDTSKITPEIDSSYFDMLKKTVFNVNILNFIKIDDRSSLTKPGTKAGESKIVKDQTMEVYRYSPSCEKFIQV
jgi:WD40 repeat protein